MKLKPLSCFGVISPYNVVYSLCKNCAFIKECEAEFEKAEKEYRY